MRFSVLQFPGGNSDQDCVHAVRSLGHEAKYLWHKESAIGETDAVLVPGGFSYGDYLRAGAIARFSPIMQSLVDFANQGGLVLGICNGFQILCESKLLPGTLLHNDHQKFTCKNIHIKAANNASIINKSVSADEALKIPIAHAEGRFFAPDDILKSLEDNQQVIYRYCDENGEVTDESNPNGSMNNIAGVCNENRNVFGMMPHPERAADAELGNTDGMKIFQSMVEQIIA